MLPCFAFAQDTQISAVIQETENNETRNLTQIVQRPDDDLLLFSLNLGRVMLLDVLLTYEDLETGQYFVPLSDFVDALEFPISVHPTNGTASGWFMDERRTFSLNLSTGIATIAGKEHTLPPSEIEHHEDGIYVSLKQIQEWFPITADIDFGQLAIVIKSLEPLPIEVRLARDKKREKIRKATRNKRKEYPLDNIKAPAFTYPLINTNTQFTFEKKDNIEKPLTASATTLISGIIAGQDTNISLNKSTASDDGVNIRASIGLKNLNNTLFGVLGREYKLGDINTRTIPLLTKSASGRGLYYSTMPLNSSSAQSGTIELRGELPVGYQVDVMRNGQLLGFIEEPDENGEYIFNLNVFPGLNTFELVFYGPQGQKETREERHYIPTNPIQKGRFGFKTALIQDSTSLFADRSTGTDDDEGKYRVTAEAQYGLSDKSSLYTALVDTSIEGTRQRYGLLRYSRSFKGIRADFSYAHSSESGQSASIRFQSIFRGIRWQIQHDYFNGFASEETLNAGLAGELEHSSNLRLSGLLPLVKNIPFSFNLDRLSNIEGTTRISWQGRITKNINKIRTTTELKQQIETNRDRKTDITFQIGSRYNNVSLRGGITYELEPLSVLKNVSLNADWHINNRSSLRLGLRRSGAVNPVHTISLGGSHSFDPIKIGFNMSYDNNDELRALLSSSFSLGKNPYKTSPFMRSKRMAETAMFAPRVFFDKNNNAIFDENDEWMKDVKFSGPRINRTAQTNKDGYVLLAGITPYERGTFQVNTSSLSDPFMRPKTSPQDYILRPGQVVKKDYPIVLVGETDGDIKLIRQGTKLPAQSIAVQIISPTEQTIISTGKSEYDGFIWIQDIPMGDYIARINPEQIKELGYCTPKDQHITLNSEEPFASLDEFLLWPIQQEGKATIMIAQSIPLDRAKELWLTIKPEITDIFLDPSQYPASYITQADNSDQSKDTNESHDLILYDMDIIDANVMCDQLTNKGIPCNIVERKNDCPSNITEIPQLERTAEFSQTINEELENTDILDENMLRDITEEELIDILNN